MENQNKKILIVEDDKDFLWILRQNFNGKGFDISFAQDGEEGLRMAEDQKPDLIILDILMPKMDGATMAKRLKNKGIKSQIIFLTNLRGELPVVQGIVDQSDYFVKSNVRVDEIVARAKEKLGVK